MINRDILPVLHDLAEQFPIIGIMGPRQSGKSTLAKMAFPNKKYITLDDQNYRQMAISNPKDFLKAFPDGLVIDEVQKVPEIFNAVKSLVDENEYETGKYILTGSSQFKLKTNMSDSLAGRIGTIKLLPFSSKELNQAELLPHNFYDFILKGNYPPLYDPKRHFKPSTWFENYIDSYLDLDIAEQINFNNLSTFKKFIQICALSSGNQISVDAISRNVGVSAPTIKNWLSMLENSFIIHFLEPDTNNLGKNLVKSSKLYFVDTGLLCHLLRIKTKEDLLLSNHKGAIVETMAVAELLKNRINQGQKPNLTYFRDLKGFEVDTIANWNHSFAVEIKSNEDTEKNLSKNVKKYLDLRADSQTTGAVFYTGDMDIKINDIQYVSWKNWGYFG